MSEKDIRELMGLSEKCPKCTHPKSDHMKIPFPTDRVKGRKPVFSACRECWKANKECKHYLTKK